MNILLNVLVTVSITLLVAVGLYIVYGLMNVINMAHGELLTIGAFTVVIASEHGVPFWLGALLAAGVAGLVGLVLEAVVIRRLYGVGGLSTLLATWGVAIAAQQLLRIVFGPSAQFVSAPVSGTVNVLGTDYSAYRLVLLGVSVVVLTGLVLVFTRTSLGLTVRATMDGSDRAEAMGINSRRVYAVTFVVGSAMAGLAGALIAPLASVTPLMGTQYVVQAFLVVMVGGVGNVLAPIAGAVLIGGSSSLMTNYIGATPAQIAVLGGVVVAIYFRPNGLYGKSVVR
jgi:branched-chain amino acid transport system permease protein/urea transport system permease protein